jgi:hypothetical protein
VLSDTLADDGQAAARAAELGDRSVAVRHPPGMDTSRDEVLAALRSAPDGPVLRLVPLGRGLAPLRLDAGGSLVYVELSSGKQVGLSDANDEVGLLAQLHPAGDDAPLPTRCASSTSSRWSRSRPLTVCSSCRPTSCRTTACGGRTVGPSRKGP